MKVLLIQPPYTIFKTETKTCHPPLGLAYLAAALKDKHDILILDALAEGFKQSKGINGEFLRYGLSFENISRRIQEINPDVVGVSCLFSAQAENAHKVCQIAKDVNKKIITVLGGAHPSTLPQDTLKDRDIDFVVMGEGEETISNLLNLLEKEADFKALCSLEGIAFRYDGNIVANFRKKYNENLDSLPFPYWDIFPLESYFFINNPHGGPARGVPFLPVITSRGCPFDCIFCSIHNLWGRDYRKRSAENVIMELGYLKDRFGVKEILFEDDNITLDNRRAREIFSNMLTKKLNLKWSAPNGIAAQTLDNELLELMKKSGCYSISIGVESGDENILKKVIKKPIDLSKIKDIIDKANKLRLETTAFFVVGFPDENYIQLQRTFRFAEKLNADNINFFFATPLPGTRLSEICGERGLTLKNLNYGRLKSNYPNFETEYFSRENLASCVSGEMLKLYFLFFLRRPIKFIYKLFRKIIYDNRYFLRFIVKYTKIMPFKPGKNHA